MVRAFERFFNIYETRYWVIVASLPSRESAALFADSIRRYPPTRQTYVGISGAWTGQWPDFAAPGESLEAARRRLDAVRRVPAIAREDLFIFAYLPVKIRRECSMMRQHRLRVASGAYAAPLAPRPPEALPSGLETRSR